MPSVRPTPSPARPQTPGPPPAPPTLRRSSASPATSVEPPAAGRRISSPAFPKSSFCKPHPATVATGRHWVARLSKCCPDRTSHDMRTCRLGSVARPCPPGVVALLFAQSWPAVGGWATLLGSRPLHTVHIPAFWSAPRTLPVAVCLGPFAFVALGVVAPRINGWSHTRAGHNDLVLPGRTRYFETIAAFIR